MWEDGGRGGAASLSARAVVLRLTWKGVGCWVGGLCDAQTEGRCLVWEDRWEGVRRGEEPHTTLKKKSKPRKTTSSIRSHTTAQWKWQMRVRTEGTDDDHRGRATCVSRGSRAGRWPPGPTRHYGAPSGCVSVAYDPRRGGVPTASSPLGGSNARSSGGAGCERCGAYASARG